MSAAEGLIRRLDRWQQGHRAAAYVVGVIRKYGDDNGGQLAASLTYTGFVTLFPLLLVFFTILGLVASNDPALRQSVTDAVAKQFPLIGRDLTENVSTLQQSSTIGLIVGLLITVWGTLGLSQSGMYAMAQIWNIPGPQRPGYAQRLGRSGLFLLVLAVGVIATTGLASLGAFGRISDAVVVGADVLAAVVNVGMYLLGYRVLTPKGVPTKDLIRGAILAGVLWTVLQTAGALVLKHFFLHTQSVYHIFGIVLTLVAWIYLVVVVTLYSAEVNAVRARKLYPRSLVQPPLTDADRTALALQPLQNQRRPEQEIAVTFTADK